MEVEWNLRCHLPITREECLIVRRGKLIIAAENDIFISKSGHDHPPSPKKAVARLAEDIKAKLQPISRVR
jgi:hypothetical protein